jgi:hypothetical protein
MPDCCAKTVRKTLSLKGVSVVPGPSSDKANRCTDLARRALLKVLRALSGDIHDVLGVDSVSFRFLGDCQTVISGSSMGTLATTAQVALRPVLQPSFSCAAACKFANLNSLLRDLCALSAVEYTIDLTYKGCCFTLGREDPTPERADWASLQHANVAASMNRPVNTIEQQQDALFRQARRDLEAKDELLRQEHADHEATRIKLAMSNQSVLRLREGPLELDAGVLASHRPVPAPHTWTHLDESRGYPAWQRSVAEQHYGDTQPPERDELAYHSQGPAQVTLTYPNQSSLLPMSLPKYLQHFDSEPEPVAQQYFSVTQQTEPQAWGTESSSCWQESARAMHLEPVAQQNFSVTQLPEPQAWGPASSSCWQESARAMHLEPVAQQNFSVTQLPEPQAWGPESSSCWQESARAMHPGVAQLQYDATEQEIGLPIVGLAAWSGVDGAFNPSDRTGPWFLPWIGPSLNAEAPITDKSPLQSDHTLWPEPPVQTVLGAAATLPKHDHSLDGIRRLRVAKLTKLQRTALSSWLDKNSRARRTRTHLSPPRPSASCSRRRYQPIVTHSCGGWHRDRRPN